MYRQNIGSVGLSVKYRKRVYTPDDSLLPRTLFVKVINTCKQSIRALPTFLLVPLRLVINPHEVP